MPIGNPYAQTTDYFNQAALQSLAARNQARMQTPGLIGDPLAAIANMKFQAAMLQKKQNDENQARSLAAVQRLGEQLGSMYQQKQEMDQRRQMAEASTALRGRELDQQKELTLKELGMRFGGQKQQVEDALAKGDMDISAGKLDTPEAKLSQSYADRGLRGDPRKAARDSDVGEASVIINKVLDAQKTGKAVKIQAALDSNWPAAQKLIDKLGNHEAAGTLKGLFAAKFTATPEQPATPGEPSIFDDFFRWYRNSGVGVVRPQSAPMPNWFGATPNPEADRTVVPAYPVGPASQPAYDPAWMGAIDLPVRKR